MLLRMELRWPEVARRRPFEVLPEKEPPEPDTDFREFIEGLIR